MEVVGVCTARIPYKMKMMKLLLSPVCIALWPHCWLGAHGFVHGSGAVGHARCHVHPLVAVSDFHGCWLSFGRGCVLYSTLPGIIHMESMEWGVDSRNSRWNPWNGGWTPQFSHGMGDGLHTFLRWIP